MNETVINRLEELKQSYEELNLEIARPEVIRDTARYQKLAKRHAELGQIVDSIGMTDSCHILFDDRTGIKFRCDVVTGGADDFYATFIG